MYLEIAGAVDLYVILSIDGDERYLSQHFEGGIGFGVRIVFYAIRNFVNFCFYKGFLGYYFHAFQHLGIIAGIKCAQVGHPLVIGDAKTADHCTFSYRSDLQGIIPGLR